MRILKLFALVFVLSLAGRATAAETVGIYDRWKVFKSDTLCAMSLGVEGTNASSLEVLKRSDGSSIVAVANSTWTSETSVEYEVALFVNGVRYPGTAKGFQRGPRSGYALVLPKSFSADLAKASSLRISLDGVELDKLTFESPKGAVEAVDQCMGEVKAAKATKRKSGARGPEPKGQGRWSKRIHAFVGQQVKGLDVEGTALLSVGVARTGRPDSCHVMRSSGHSSLDMAACKSMTRYARFDPALDGNGKPTRGTYAASISSEKPTKAPEAITPPQ
jgi:TonB family protein